LNCPLCDNVFSEQIGVKDNFDIYQCLDCGFRYVDPYPSPKQLAEYYTNYQGVAGYNKHLSKKIITGKWKIRSMKKYCASEPKSFIDVGCNLGYNVEAARKLGLDATGIDIDVPTIEIANRYFPHCKFEAISSEEIERSFDLVFCTEVIEHLTTIQTFVASLRKICTTGGILYLTTPDAGYWKVSKDFVSWKKVVPPEHLGWFDRKTIKYILEKNGFSVKKFFWSHRANLQVIAQAI